MQATAKLTLVEAKLLSRDRALLMWGLVFPAVRLSALGLFFPGFRDPLPDAGGIRLVDLYAPIVIAMGIASLGLVTLPTYLAEYRSRGVLRRLATTPVPPRRLILAMLAVQVTTTVAGAVLALIAGAIALDIRLPVDPCGFHLGGGSHHHRAVRRRHGDRRPRPEPLGGAGHRNADLLPLAVLRRRLLPPWRHARRVEGGERSDAERRRGSGDAGHMVGVCTARDGYSVCVGGRDRCRKHGGGAVLPLGVIPRVSPDMSPAAGQAQTEGPDAVAERLSNLNRRYDTVVRFVPYVLLVISAVLSFVSDSTLVGTLPGWPCWWRCPLAGST